MPNIKIVTNKNNAEYNINFCFLFIYDKEAGKQKMNLMTMRIGKQKTKTGI